MYEAIGQVLIGRSARCLTAKGSSLRKTLRDRCIELQREENATQEKVKKQEDIFPANWTELDQMNDVRARRKWFAVFKVIEEVPRH